ncbi:MAG: micrococcal nuclease [Frankiales bacterium]|nr:micrococcal nuclease [Frankiales bacterium]
MRTIDARQGRFDATVVRIVDGDTFIARRAGVAKTIRVRVIGIDTPETVKPGTPPRCWGAEASALTKRLLPTGVVVRAAYEHGGATDRYGRDLWDVWLPDGRFLAAELVTTGAARAYRVRPQTEQADLLARLDSAARRDHRGLWGPPCNGRSFGQ